MSKSTLKNKEINKIIEEAKNKNIDFNEELKYEKTNTRTSGVVPVRGLRSFSLNSKKNKQLNNKPKFVPKRIREAYKNKLELYKKNKTRALKKNLAKARKEFIKKVNEHEKTQTKRKNHNNADQLRYKSSSKPKSLKNENEKKKIKLMTEQSSEITNDIKNTYLGRKKREKRLIPKTQRERFAFDWRPEDDTSQDHNELYQKKPNVSLAFGRGFIAGVDRNVQKGKKTLYRELVKKFKEKDTTILRKILEKKSKRENRNKKKEKIKNKIEKHWRKKKLKDMINRDWRILREDFNISTRGSCVPNPIRYWKETNFPKIILKKLEKIKYIEPTPIQRIAIPTGIANRDVVGIAETGSGKTCAFVIPMLMYISKLPPMNVKTISEGPYSLILAPSRELALQIENEVRKFSDDMGIKTISIVGGLSIEKQSMEVREGAEIIIATPGRLYDCLDRRFLVLNQCNYIVLDEADRMMDMGFEPQVISILEKMPSSNLQPENPEEINEKLVYRQTFMFSATMPLKVENITKKYLRNPIYISIGDRTGKISENIEQHFKFLTDNEKNKELLNILQHSIPPIMIFANKKKMCDQLTTFLCNEGISCTSLHSGKNQEQRGRALDAFRDKHIDVLICTDVAGRGINVKGITHVINYDFPKCIEDYTHRIGRTGRAGAKGEATSFLTNGNEDIFFDLRNLLLETRCIIPYELDSHPASRKNPDDFSKMPKIIYRE